jgi:hypothetical protein
MMTLDILDRFAPHAHLSFSSLSWQALPPLVATEQTEEAGIFSFDLGMGWNIIDNTYANNKFLISIEVGYALRDIFGDVSLDPTFRQAILDSTSTMFGGYEFTMTLAINGLIAQFTYVQLNKDVPGLSTGDMTVSAGIQVGLVSFVLTPPPKQAAQ